MNTKRARIWTCLPSGDPPPCGRTTVKLACGWYYQQYGRKGPECQNLKWLQDWQAKAWLEKAEIEEAAQ